MDTYSLNEAEQATRHGRRWLLAIGAVSILLGIAALIFPFAVTLGVELMFGASLLVVGVLELVRLFADRPPGGIALGVLFAALAIVAGVLLLMYPLEGVLTLTMVLTFFFLAGGALKSLAAYALRPAPAWGWMLASGLMSIVLGAIVLFTLPESAFWLPGILVGIDLLFFGSAQIALARAAGNVDAIGST